MFLAHTSYLFSGKLLLIYGILMSSGLCDESLLKIFIIERGAGYVHCSNKRFTYRFSEKM